MAFEPPKRPNLGWQTERGWSTATIETAGLRLPARPTITVEYRDSSGKKTPLSSGYILTAIINASDQTRLPFG